MSKNTINYRKHLRRGPLILLGSSNLYPGLGFMYINSLAMVSVQFVQVCPDTYYR